MNFEPLSNSLFGHLATAVLILDEDLVLQQINASAEDLLSISCSRHIGAPLRDLLKEPDDTLGILQQTLANGQPHTQREAELKVIHGAEVVKVAVDYTVSRIEHGDNRYLLMEMQPINRLLRINRDASVFSVQQSSGAFLKGLAHEIKNPLGGIRGAAQLLEQELDSEELSEYTRIIIDEADRLRNLVNRMLTPSTAKSMRKTNIHEVLERVRQLIDAEVGNSIDIYRDYDPSIPAIDADPDSLIQAALNIARNAVRALMSEEDGERKSSQPRRLAFFSRIVRYFTIGPKQHRLVCRIDITDNGPGIPDALRNSLFMPMVSGYANSSGLGLAISQSIINQHHGLITCQSEPGDTCFSIFLPLDDCDL